MDKKISRKSPRELTYDSLLKQYKKYLNTSDKIRAVLLAYKNKQIMNKATAQHLSLIHI